MNQSVRNAQAGLIAAYRRGMGLAAVAPVRDDTGGMRIAALPADDDSVVAARWWCLRADEAERVAAAATRRLRRRQTDLLPSVPGKTTAQSEPAAAEASARLANESIAAAANALGIALHTDEDIVQAAMAAAARVDSEVERMQRAGELKSVNKSYQSYRLEASARGERVMRYQDWMRRYKEDLLCKLAATLRYL